MAMDVTRVRCAFDTASRKGLLQQWFSLGCLLLVGLDSLLISLSGITDRYALLGLYGSMLVLLMLCAIRYGLAQTGQISRYYRKTLWGWRILLYDLVKFGAPVLCVAGLAAGAALCLL